MEFDRKESKKEEDNRKQEKERLNMVTYALIGIGIIAILIVLVILLKKKYDNNKIEY